MQSLSTFLWTLGGLMVLIFIIIVIIGHVGLRIDNLRMELALNQKKIDNLEYQEINKDNIIKNRNETIESLKSTLDGNDCRMSNQAIVIVERDQEIEFLKSKLAVAESDFSIIKRRADQCSEQVNKLTQQVVGISKILQS